MPRERRSMSRFKYLRWAVAGAAVAGLVAVAAGTAANGGNFILGAANSATARTSLTTTTSEAALQLTNNGTGVPLSLVAPGGQAPIKSNSTVKVGNLNADLLDGVDSAFLWKTTGNAGTGSSAFL